MEYNKDVIVENFEIKDDLLWAYPVEDGSIVICVDSSDGYFTRSVTVEDMQKIVDRAKELKQAKSANGE